MTWKTDLDYLKAAAAEQRDYNGMMSDYERHVIGEDIKAKRAAAWPGIAAGVADTFRRAKDKYQAAQAQERAVRQKEAARWDNAKLSGEMAAIKQLTDLALSAPIDPLNPASNPGAKLAAIYEDAKAAGDIHRARAAAEIISKIDPLKLPQGDRYPGAQLRALAEMDLKSLRTVEGLEQAEQAKAAAYQDVSQVVSLVREASIVCGQGDPSDPVFPTSSLSPLVRSVRRGDDGELFFLADNDPEVTGIMPLESVA